MSTSDNGSERGGARQGPEAGNAITRLIWWASEFPYNILPGGATGFTQLTIADSQPPVTPQRGADLPAAPIQPSNAPSGPATAAAGPEVIDLTLEVIDLTDSPLQARPSGETSAILNECPICLSEFKVLSTKGRSLLSTRCGHVFCSRCLLRVVTRRAAPICPICRTPVTRKDCHPIFLFK
jgi:hypothetical protein